MDIYPATSDHVSSKQWSERDASFDDRCLLQTSIQGTLGQTNADRNFLKAFKKATGLKTRSYSEEHPISALASYPDDAFPPFVFMTGNGRMGRVSNAEVKILRAYCKQGGMIVGDAGSGEFNSDFRALMRRVFPSNGMIDIADDDRLFQIPFRFPNGAPRFWSHGGTRAMGVKLDRRWVVFYHPGDMNDAWKSKSYSDVTPEMRKVTRVTIA